jgi:hypothetical protein
LPNWDISRGFLYVCIIYIAGRIRAAVRGRGHKFFSLAGPVEYFTSNIKNQSLGNPVERYTVRPWQPSLSLKRSILLLKISRDEA